MIFYELFKLNFFSLFKFVSTDTANVIILQHIIFTLTGTTTSLLQSVFITSSWASKAAAAVVLAIFLVCPCPEGVPWLPSNLSR